MQYNVTQFANGVVIGGVNNTDIIFALGGIFNLQFSAQITCNTPQAHLFYVWLCKNGTAVTDSASITTVHGTHGGNNGHLILALNFMFVAVPGDSYQLCWTADDTAVRLETITAPTVTIPQSPAVILTIQKI